MTCKHCAQPVPRSGDEFCCPACRVVYETICGAGLGVYYERREMAPARPAAGTDRSRDWMNRPEVAEPYLARLPDGKVRATFVLDGLHCSACCWLVEKAVGQLCDDARVNYSTSLLTAVWQPETLGVGDVMARVASVGYRATPRAADGTVSDSTPADRTALMRLGVAGFSAGNVMLLAAAMYCGAFSGMEASYLTFFHWISLVLCLPVIAFSAVPFWHGAWAALRHRVVTMDLPIAIGLLTTFLYSVWATLDGKPHVYFDTVAMFVFVLLIGRSLERGSQRRVAGAVERLLALGARTARKQVGDDHVEVDVRSLVPGDVVQVLPGEKVPVDGVVLEGRAWVDEAMLTGEATPVSKAAGATVTGATLCVDGTLHVQATRTGNDTTLSQISHLVEEAQARRAPVQRLADRAAATFILVVLTLSAATYWLWHAHGVEHALMVAVSVLIVTCPCALGLATPLAVAAACGRAAAQGVLFRGGDVLEALHGATRVVLDKTGTVTDGALEVQAVFARDRDAALAVAAALELQATHPLARAIVQACERPARATDVTTWPGLGVEGLVDGRRARLGSETFLRERGLTLPQGLAQDAAAAEARGQTVVWLALEDEAAAAFALADRVRADSREVVRWLQARGLRVTLLSGDRPGAVAAVATAVGIEDWRGLVRPEEKARVIRDMQAQGERVVMVGDGINDALALTTADVGMALSNGADVAHAAAGVVMLRPGLRPLQDALTVAGDAFRTLRGNLGVGVVYNLVAIPTAMAGLLVPLAAAVAMPVSSLVVVANSLRLWQSPRPRSARPEARLAEALS